MPNTEGNRANNVDNQSSSGGMPPQPRAENHPPTHPTNQAAINNGTATPSAQPVIIDPVQMLLVQSNLMNEIQALIA